MVPLEGSLVVIREGGCEEESGRGQQFTGDANR